MAALAPASRQAGVAQAAQAAAHYLYQYSAFSIALHALDVVNRIFKHHLTPYRLNRPLSLMSGKTDAIFSSLTAVSSLC